MASAPPQSIVRFREFALDLGNESLFRDGEAVPIRPKPLAVLVHLVARRPHLVSKDELLATLWSDATVGEWVLTTAVKELRQALGDDPRSPSIIETAHRRGYRFIAETARDAPEEPAAGLPGIVGRDEELAQLDDAWRAATAGRRQLVFVVGEAGIGKTAVVDSFVARRAADPECLVAHGQSLEQFSAVEPYLPLLSAFGRIDGSARGREFLKRLARYAPSWRGLLPGTGDGEAPSSAVPPSPERMLRELVASLEASEHPLVLVLEDLHWSDYATLDVVNRLARGRSASRLLLVVTYRAAELALRDHPLKTMHRELHAQSLCRDIWLPPLRTSAIADYVARRFPGLGDIPALAGQIAHRTDGNALFVVNVTDELETSGTIARSGDGWTFHGRVDDVATAVPTGLRQLLAMRVDRLDAAERDLLEVCSVVGRTASAQEVAAALELPCHKVDASLASVSRRLFLLRDAGETSWPDGSVGGRYEFAHSLYRDVLLELAPPALRRVWHERVARRIEKGFEGRTSEVATSLARHLEAAGLGEAAVHYFEEAAERATRYGAERDGAALLDRAIAILESLPRTPERTLRTLRLEMGLGQLLQAKNGFANHESAAAFARAWRLAEELEDPVQLFQAAIGLLSSYLGCARFEDARRIAERLPGLMDQVVFPPFMFTGHLFLGMTSYHSGSLAEARSHFDSALEIGDFPQPTIFLDFQVVLLSYRALTLIHQGEREQALESVGLAMRRVESGGPFVQAVAATWSMFVHLIAGDADGVETAARTAETLGADNGYPLPSAVGRFGCGWAEAQRGRVEEGVEAMRRAIDDFRRSGQVTALPAMLASMASVVLDAGRPAAALEILDEVDTLIRESGEVRFTVEVLRLQGECRAASGDIGEARLLFGRALELAREQGAAWWESRVEQSLRARLPT